MPSSYVFPVPLHKADSYERGKRIVVMHRNGYAVTGIIIKIDFGATVALVEMTVDAREL